MAWPSGHIMLTVTTTCDRCSSHRVTGVRLEGSLVISLHLQGWPTLAWFPLRVPARLVIRYVNHIEIKPCELFDLLQDL